MILRVTLSVSSPLSSSPFLQDERESIDTKIDARSNKEIIFFTFTSLSLYSAAGNTLNVVFLEPHKEYRNRRCDDDRCRAEGSEVFLDHLTLKPLVHTERYGVHSDVGSARHNEGYENVVAPGGDERGENGVDDDGFTEREYDLVEGSESRCAVNTRRFVKRFRNRIKESLSYVVAESRARRINDYKAEV